MVDRAGSSLLNFDTGITRILNQPTETASQLPGKARLAPTDARAMNIMNRLLDADNVQTMLEKGLSPTVSDRDVLQPHKFMDSINDAESSIDTMIDNARTPEEKKALQTLKEQINTMRERRDEVDSYMNALIGG